MRNKNLVVMVIDNNSDLKIEQELQHSGYQIITRHNLSQAIEDVADFTNPRRPDVILLEMDQVPAEEIWMVRTLREATQCPDLPIICLGRPKESAGAQGMISTSELNRLINQNESDQLSRLIDEVLASCPKALASNAN